MSLIRFVVLWAVFSCPALVLSFENDIDTNDDSDVTVTSVGDRSSACDTWCSCKSDFGQGETYCCPNGRLDSRRCPQRSSNCYGRYCDGIPASINFPIATTTSSRCCQPAVPECGSRLNRVLGMCGATYTNRCSTRNCPNADPCCSQPPAVRVGLHLRDAILEVVERSHRSSKAQFVRDIDYVIRRADNYAWDAVTDYRRFHSRPTGVDENSEDLSDGVPIEETEK